MRIRYGGLELSWEGVVEKIPSDRNRAIGTLEICMAQPTRRERQQAWKRRALLHLQHGLPSERA